LFAVLGTTYGSGDGSTTFGLPDLRGRVVAGQDDMGGTSANRLTNPAATTGGIDGDVLGGTGGSETHTLTTTQMPAHNHTGSISPSTVYTTSSPFWGTTYGAPEIGVNYAFNTSVTINNTGGGAAHNNVQPTMVLNYIIKA
jgi:microcystin-dependent protein